MKNKEPKKIVFLASGGGGTMQFIFYALQQLKFEISIVGVIADRDCKALDFVKQKNIQHKIVNYSKQNPTELQDAITEFQPDIIITTFHKIIDEETLRFFKDVIFINPHYSILPAFKGSVGIKTILKAKALNCGFVGASAHHVIAESDAGKIISQAVIATPNWDLVNQIQLNDAVFKATGIILLNAIVMQIEPLNTLQKAVKKYCINGFDVNISPDIINEMNDTDNWLAEFDKINF
jgi:phosphoribosylglycinamide formyltransferase-1